MARNLTHDILHPSLPLLLLLLPPALRIPLPTSLNEPPHRRSRRRPIDLDLAFGALDADGRPGGIPTVRVRRDAEVCERDAVRRMGCRAAGVGGGGEGQEDGGVFVGPRGGVFLDGGEDGGRGFAVGGGDGVVEGLEAPG